MTQAVKNILTGVLVGMHFRPPAKLILECLRAGTALRLQHEADNAYDSSAVQVHAKCGDVPVSQHQRLEAELPGYGWSFEDFLQKVSSEDEVFLGYIAASKNKVLKKEEGLVSNEIFLAAQELVAWDDCQITLGFSPAGLPLVILKAGE